MEKSEVLDFVRRMKATDHVILFYSNPEDKRHVLFTYLKEGLARGEAGAYVVSQETPDQIKQAMEEFGLDVEALEKSGGLRVIDYRDWYFIGGSFSAAKTMELWKNLYEEVMAKGFKGLRVTGEMACFFERGMIGELVEYERALHRVLELPITAICCYDTDVVSKEGSGTLFLDLIKAHSTVIFLGPRGGVIKTY